MSETHRSELVSFDANAAVDAARDVAGDRLHLCVEYTVTEFHVLYADGLTLSLYGDREQMHEHFEKVHSYVNIDFTEVHLFEDLMVAAGGVRAFATYMDHITLIRVFSGEQEGLFLTLDPDARATDVVEAVRDALE